MHLIKVYIQLFSLLAALLLIPALPLQAKSTPAPPPAKSSSNSMGHDKRSDELWAIYQQNRLNNKNNSKPTNGIKLSGPQRPPLKKIIFHKSATASKGSKPSSPSLPSKTSSKSMGGGY